MFTCQEAVRLTPQPTDVQVARDVALDADVAHSSDMSGSLGFVRT